MHKSWLIFLKAISPGSPKRAGVTLEKQKTPGQDRAHPAEGRYIACIYRDITQHKVEMSADDVEGETTIALIEENDFEDMFMRQASII